MRHRVTASRRLSPGNVQPCRISARNVRPRSVLVNDVRVLADRVRPEARSFVGVTARNLPGQRDGSGARERLPGG